MKSLEKLKVALGDIEINEEQRAALDEFLLELVESLKQKATAEVEEELSDLRERLEESEKEKESRDDNEWVRVEEAEAAFNLAMKDAETAFNKAQEDVLNESAEKMTAALEDLYESLKEKATAEILESPQFESLQKIKNILAPMILEENSSDSLLKELQVLKTTIKEMSSKKESLEKEKIIESLVEELPKKEGRVIREYLLEASNVEEVYDRYNLAISILEAKDEEEHDEDGNDNDNEDEDEEVVDVEEEEENDEVVTESVIFPSRSVEKREEKKKGFSSIEEAIISTVFKK